MTKRRLIAVLAAFFMLAAFFVFNTNSGYFAFGKSDAFPVHPSLASNSTVPTTAHVQPMVIPTTTNNRPAPVVDANDASTAQTVLLDERVDDTSRNEAINFLRAAHDPPLDSDLIQVLNRDYENERFRAFCAQHIGLSLASADTDTVRGRVLTDRLLSALTDRHTAVRREALLALVRARDYRALEIVRNGLSDPDWLCAKDLIVRCFLDLDWRERAADVRPLVSDNSLVTRIAAIYVLGEWRDRDSKLALVEASESVNIRIRIAANAALEKLP
jgi:hypothetical protein